MFEHSCNPKRLLICAALVFAVGCGGKKTPETTTPGSQGGGSKAAAVGSKTFAPLEKAKTAVDLPVLLGEDGIDERACFPLAENLAPRAANAEVADSVERNASAINSAIAQWFVDDLELDLDEDTVGGWQIEIGDLYTVSVSPEDLRFSEGQECIERGSGRLADDLRAVVKFIGARELSFTSPSPLDVDLQEEMIAAVSAYNIILESEDLFVWEVARDSDNEPKVDENDEELYTSPTGVLIPESEVPPLEERGMKTWTLKAESPIYFAYSEITDEYWRREGKKKKCDVFLVWGDVTPYAPECEEFQEASFTAKGSGDNEVTITIVAGDDKVEKVLEFGQGDMIEVNDRIILWLKPKKLEEGVMLQLNSLVLNPRPIAGAPIKEKEEDAYAAPSPKVDQEKPEKKSSKKKEIKTDQDSIDAFLGD